MQHGEQDLDHLLLCLSAGGGSRGTMVTSAVIVVVLAELMRDPAATAANRASPQSRKSEPSPGLTGHARLVIGKPLLDHLPYIRRHNRRNGDLDALRCFPISQVVTHL